jgi:hypothetical protein
VFIYLVVDLPQASTFNNRNISRWIERVIVGREEGDIMPGKRLEERASLLVFLFLFFDS